MASIISSLLSVLKTVLGGRLHQYGTTIGIFAQGYDVTDVVEAQAAKRESDERLREGMDAAKMVVWDWNLATGELVCSENVQRVLGYAPANRGEIKAYLHVDDRERLSAAHRAALEGLGSYQEVVRFNRPDTGQQIWLDSRGKVRNDSDGKPASVRGVSVDVTERYQAELELREANHKKDEFLAMLAHELRNPLAPISTAAEMLNMTSGGNVGIKKASEVIGRQVKHMTSLVDDLLDVSRVTRGLVQLDKEYVDITALVASAVEQSRSLIDSRGHSLTVSTVACSSIVEGDRTRLVQVIANLLNNAAKYTPRGGKIALTLRSEDQRVQMTVADNGIGIEAALLPHVFDLFTQAARTPDRTQGGLGIGLALVKNIVALHGGSVTARSRGPGAGSTFTILLPAASPAPDERRTRAVTKQTFVPKKAIHAMIVDDNVDAGESLAALMELHGHRVSVFTHPLEAIPAAFADPPQIFILDIGLPGIDGYELSRRLRGDPRTAGAQFIALTGYGQAHDRVLSASVGFDHHFVKPIDMGRLNAVLENEYGEKQSDLSSGH